MGGLAILSGYLLASDLAVRVVFWLACYGLGVLTGWLIRRLAR